MEFDSEKIAIEMKNEISKMTSGGEPFYVDFVGEKSEDPNKKNPKLVDPLK